MNDTSPLTRRSFVQGLASAALCLPVACHAQTAPARSDTLATTQAARQLINAARSQIGITTSYDPSYTRLSYPGGDVSRAKGVCTDVVIRAYRDALDLDLQTLVHRDMGENFKLYPRSWGLNHPDTNIDHRRVPNLQTFFSRQQAKIIDSQGALDWRPGDIFTCLINNRLPHIGIVSDRHLNGRLLVIHNIGSGTREEDMLFTYPLTGHFRWRVS